MAERVGGGASEPALFGGKKREGKPRPRRNGEPEGKKTRGKKNPREKKPRLVFAPKQTHHQQRHRQYLSPTKSINQQKPNQTNKTTPKTTNNSTVLEVMAELMGKKTGASHGLGGSMHMYRRQANFFGGCGIVGAQIPLGAGLALAHKYSGRRNVAVRYGFGGVGFFCFFFSLVARSVDRSVGRSVAAAGSGGRGGRFGSRRAGAAPLFSVSRSYQWRRPPACCVLSAGAWSKTGKKGGSKRGRTRPACPPHAPPPHHAKTTPPAPPSPQNKNVRRPPPPRLYYTLYTTFYIHTTTLL